MSEWKLHTGTVPVGFGFGLSTSPVEWTEPSGAVNVLARGSDGRVYARSVASGLGAPPAGASAIGSYNYSVGTTGGASFTASSAAVLQLPQAVQQAAAALASAYATATINADGSSNPPASTTSNGYYLQLGQPQQKSGRLTIAVYVYQLPPPVSTQPTSYGSGGFKPGPLHHEVTRALNTSFHGAGLGDATGVVDTPPSGPGAVGNFGSSPAVSSTASTSAVAPSNIATNLAAAGAAPVASPAAATPTDYTTPALLVGGLLGVGGLLYLYHTRER